MTSAEVLHERMAGNDDPVVATPLAGDLDVSSSPVAVGQAEAQVPADRDGDDLGREAKADEGRPRSGSRARAAGFIPAVSLVGWGHSQCNSPRPRSTEPKLAGVGRLGRRRQDAASVGTGRVLHLLMDDQSGRTRLSS